MSQAALCNSKFKNSRSFSVKAGCSIKFGARKGAGGKLMSAWPGADAWMCQSQPLDGSVDTSHAMLDVLFRKRNWDFFFIL